MTEETESAFEFDEQAWRDELDSPAFKHGQSIGESWGHHKATEEAIRAYEAGEIDLWIAFMRPKTMEDWDAWEKEHGSSEELHKRWAPPTDE